MLFNYEDYGPVGPYQWQANIWHLKWNTPLQLSTIS